MQFPIYTELVFVVSAVPRDHSVPKHRNLYLGITPEFRFQLRRIPKSRLSRIPTTIERDLKTKVFRPRCGLCLYIIGALYMFVRVAPTCSIFLP